MISLFLFGMPPLRRRNGEPVVPVRDATRPPTASQIAMECPKARRVSMPSGTVLLSPREWALMEVFTANPGVTLPRADLLTQVWGPDYPGTPRVVDVRVGQLRRKLERAGGRCIETVHGAGYRFVERRSPRPSTTR
jgi:DNA-binding response OmpR family regulator